MTMLSAVFKRVIMFTWWWLVWSHMMVSGRELSQFAMLGTWSNALLVTNVQLLQCHKFYDHTHTNPHMSVLWHLLRHSQLRTIKMTSATLPSKLSKQGRVAISYQDKLIKTAQRSDFLWNKSAISAPLCCSSSLGRRGKRWRGQPRWVCSPPDINVRLIQRRKKRKTECIYNNKKHFLREKQIWWLNLPWTDHPSQLITSPYDPEVQGLICESISKAAKRSNLKM